MFHRFPPIRHATFFHRGSSGPVNTGEPAISGVGQRCLRCDLISGSGLGCQSDQDWDQPLGPGFIIEGARTRCWVLTVPEAAEQTEGKEGLLRGVIQPCEIPRLSSRSGGGRF